MRVLGVQRTGPTVRVSAETRSGGLPLRVDLPHLHHDVPGFVVGGEVRLRLTQFSVFPRTGPAPARRDAPVLIGRERERGRAGG